MILVTGATGNAGGAVVRALLERGEKVRGLVRTAAFIHFYVDGSVDESHVLSTVEDITGRKPGTFECWARDYVEAFR